MTTNAAPSQEALGRVHFIGIGGVGMSAVARIMVARGIPVSGSDAKDLPVMAELAAAGARICVGYGAGNLGDAQTVVAGSAIRADNPELEAARAAGLPVLHRSEALAATMGDDLVVTVAGTHGKSTTTSMITVLLQGTGLDPSFAIGANVPALGVNAANGSSHVFVAEADESDGSFLNYRPQIAVVTNVEPDHLDYYGTAEAVYESFDRFTELLPADGVLVACADDAGAHALALRTRERGNARVVLYGTSEAADLRLDDGGPGRVAITTAGGRFPLALQVPGRHNALNAAAAMAVALELGVDAQAAASALAGFSGASRRFEYKGRAGACGSTTTTPTTPRRYAPPSPPPGPWPATTRCMSFSSRTCSPGPGSLPQSSPTRSMPRTPPWCSRSTRLARIPSRASPARSSPSISAQAAARSVATRPLPFWPPPRSRGTSSSPRAPGTSLPSGRSSWSPSVASTRRPTYRPAKPAARDSAGRDTVGRDTAADPDGGKPAVITATKGMPEGTAQEKVQAGTPKGNTAPKGKPAPKGKAQAKPAKAPWPRLKSPGPAKPGPVTTGPDATAPDTAGQDNVLAFPEPRGRRIRRNLIVAVCLTAALVAGLIAAAIYSPVLAVQSVSVTGTKLLKPAQVQAALKPLLGTPLPQVSDDDVTRCSSRSSRSSRSPPRPTRRPSWWCRFRNASPSPS
jgi:UDP-N-acetylmuramate--alanine ligase